MYILERQQLVNASMEQAWAFLQNPANLDRITPPDLQFRIVTDIPPRRCRSPHRNSPRQREAPGLC